ncbi:pentatricopeptide repeat-containing protein At1g33350 [Aristolochia californica]|uniref:pentatricopeptide repeat-containing protein At1g33350 n=1 Tax=Aristolochia californica TaxID=171875 RepID=UPI0035DF5E0D
MNSASVALNEKVLHLLRKCKHLAHLKQLQAFLIALGHEQSHFYSFKLLRFCALALSNLQYARRIFDHIDSPNTHLYTAIITAYSSVGDSHAVFILYNQMLRRGHPRPNHFVFPHVLRSCSDECDLKGVQSIHPHVVKWGFDGYSVVQTALVDGYAKCSLICSARDLFDEMSDRTVVSWTAMLFGYARMGLVGNAVSIFEEMPDRDVPSWNAVISGCTQNGLFPVAVSLFQRMVLAGERPNETTLVCALSACAHLGMLRLGRWIHGYVYRNKIGLNSFICNALLDMYGKCGSLVQSALLFDMNLGKSLASWNSLINCLALHGQNEKAIAAFKDMENMGFKPVGVTFVGLLNACTHAGLLDEGRKYFKLMSEHYGIEPQIQHYGCFIDLLCRVGSFEEAMGVISGMKMKPDEVIWGSLLNGSRIHGNMELAEFALQKLLEMHPDNAGYGRMLANIYCESGKWEDVDNVREMVEDKGGQKTPGCSWIEVNNKLEQFYSGDGQPATADQQILFVLQSLSELSIYDL